MATSPLTRLTEDERLSPLVDAVMTVAAREAPWRRAFLAQIAPKPHDVIIEIGASAGAMALTLAQAQPRATLIVVESDEAVLERAHARATEANAQTITFVHGRARDLAQLTAHWAPTKIVSCLALHNFALHEKLSILRAAHEAIRADGRLHCAEYGAQRTPLMRSLYRTFQGVDLETPEPLARTIRDAGFRAVDEARTFDTLTGSLSLISARAH